MNLQQLEYFKTIAETENFTTSAKLLSITQPALSKAISKLEDELKVPLFEKKGRNIKITRFGKTFLIYANRALTEIDKGINELKEMISEDRGTISISSTPRIGVYFMNFFISDFLNNNPDTKFQFNQQSVDSIVENLKIGKIDIGFYDSEYKIDDNYDIESIPIKKQEYVLIVPKNHIFSNREEISLKELKDEYFIAYNDKSSDKRISYSDFMGYTPKISAEPTEASVLSGLVAAGAGIAIIINTPMINTNKISTIKIKEDIGYKSIYIGWNRDSYMTEIRKAFKEYVLSLSEDV